MERRKTQRRRRGRTGVWWLDDGVKDKHDVVIRGSGGGNRNVFESGFDHGSGGRVVRDGIAREVIFGAQVGPGPWDPRSEERMVVAEGKRFSEDV